ncbi:MAG: hypothetical protein K2J73_11445 [Oscillospiraceae bacterium]|nr:hypothetical protein [Oscillospiraceae bacterium]
MKFKKIISVLLSCVLVLSLPITAYAADKKLSSDMSLEDLRKFAKKNTYSYKIYEYEKENAEMQKDGKKNELEYYEYLIRGTSKCD